MNTQEVVTTVPPSHVFLGELLDELPGHELEAKLEIAEFVEDPKYTVELLVGSIATSSECIIVIEERIEAEDTVQKYWCNRKKHDSGHFSVVHRAKGKGDRFVKYKPNKDISPDGVIHFTEYKTLWPKGDLFPADAGVDLEKSESIGEELNRKKNGFFVQMDNGRVYQVVLDTVTHGKGERKQTLQQVEVEYKGNTNTPPKTSEAELVTAISGDIVNIRDLVQVHLSERIVAKPTTQTKSNWLLEILDQS